MVVMGIVYQWEAVVLCDTISTMAGHISALPPHYLLKVSTEQEGGGGNKLISCSGLHFVKRDDDQGPPHSSVFVRGRVSWSLWSFEAP